MCVCGTMTNPWLLGQSFLRGIGMNYWSLFFSCKLWDRIGSSLLKELYLWITALISLLSVMLSISLLQEFTFGQLIHQLSICPHPETANRAQVCWGFTREDCFPSFPQWTAVAKTQPLALQMCSVTRQSQKVFNSCLPDHSFTAKDSLSFALYPILTSAVPSPSLKHLKQQLQKLKHFKCPSTETRFKAMTFRKRNY